MDPLIGSLLPYTPLLKLSITTSYLSYAWETASSQDIYSSSPAPSPTLFMASGETISSLSLAASEAEFSSIRKPFLPSVTPSDAQLSFMMTDAVLLAAASLTTRPLVSKVDGKRKRSARLYHALKCSLSLTAPVNMTLRSSPSSLAYDLTSASSPPAPTKTILKSEPSRPSSERASSMMRRPLYHMSLPMNRKQGTPSGRSKPPVTSCTRSEDTSSSGRSTPLGITMYSPS